VYASTSGVVGCQRRTTPWIVANDSSPYCKEIVKNWPYYKSKIEAEEQALAFAQKHGVELICMRPSMMLGPGDVRLRSTLTVYLFLKRKIPFTPSGGVSFVDVRDVARAFKTAMERGRPGQTYLLNAKSCSIDEWFRMLEYISNVKRPRLYLPDKLAILSAYLLNQYNVKVKKQWNEAVGPVKAEMATHYWNCSSELAQKELNFSPRNAMETLQDTIQWIKDNEFLLPIPLHSKL
jgi:dihydroflavonol-4-reductase